MKAHLPLAILLVAASSASSPADPNPLPFNDAQKARTKVNVGWASIDETQRFIFYSVLEGLYEDGVSKEDVDQILLRKEGQAYFHFIYACPVCSATIWALQAYRPRPDRFYGRKMPFDATFGPGLTAKVRKSLYSDDAHERLAAINILVKTWIERRLASMNLSPEAKAKMEEELEKKRKEGMNMLKQWRRDPIDGKNRVATEAPAYVEIEECAVCNGAVGKPMKMPEVKPQP